MSIATKKGDSGKTSLMYNRRVAKSHPRVEAYGSVDELNAALGMARAIVDDPAIAGSLLRAQQDLVTLMGELATNPDDREQYQRDGFQFVSRDLTSRLDGWIKELEERDISFRGWATPGGTPLSAALDVARTVCRRGERRVQALDETEQLVNPEILTFLNRLGDWLWLAARWVETKADR